jgi:hypothetical protein
MFQRELTGEEVARLLDRNPDIESRVLQHRNLFVGTGQWDQVRMNEANYPNLPVPAKGLHFNDTEFGSVIVAVEADGDLRFIGNVGTVPADIDAPPHQSPSGNTPEQWLKDLMNGLLQPIATGAGKGIGIAIIGVTGYWLLTRRP